MKFTGFASSFVGKLILILLCIILGVVLAFGGLAAAGYILLTKEGSMGLIDDNLEMVDYDKEIRAMSVLEWGQEVFNTISGLTDKEIGEMERLFGMSIISDTIEEIMGVNAEIVKEATLGNIGPTISNNLTIFNAQDKFGIAFPDMPIFKDEKFLQSPLATAFSDFNSYKLKDVIVIDDNSSAVLKELSDVAIGDLGGSVADEKIKGMFLCELMTIDENSNRTLNALKYASIESFFETDSRGEAVLDENGEKVYKTRTITEYVDGVPVENTYPLIGMSEKMDMLYIRDVVDINEGSNVILRKMRTPTEEEIAAGLADKFGTEDLLVNELGGDKVNEIVNETTIGELVNIYESDGVDSNGNPYTKSSNIMIALKDTPVGELDARMKELRMNEIFDADQLTSGAISLIDPETKLDDVPLAMTAAISTANVATLMGKGVIKTTDMSKMQPAQQAYILNGNMGDLLEGIVEFIAAPINEEGKPNYILITPAEIEIEEAEFASVSEFVAKYNQYSSLNFISDSVTVNVNEETDAAFYNEETDAYLIPLFNVISETELVFEGGTVMMAIYDVETVVSDEEDDVISDEEGDDVIFDGESETVVYTLSRHQYGFAYALYESTVLPEFAFDTIMTWNRQSELPVQPPVEP